jgi:hypothetical protein
MYRQAVIIVNVNAIPNFPQLDRRSKLETCGRMEQGRDRHRINIRVGANGRNLRIRTASQPTSLVPPRTRFCLLLLSILLFAVVPSSSNLKRLWVYTTAIDSKGSVHPCDIYINRGAIDASWEPLSIGEASEAERGGTWCRLQRRKHTYLTSSNHPCARLAWKSARIRVWFDLSTNTGMRFI